jgi:predicted regulator of Ras-like GTPase activity (Roadblock/LC7/MglB family)
VVFCQMRPGLKSYTSDAEYRAFMEMGPLIMSGVAERLTSTGGAGRLESVIVNMEKDSVLLTRVGSGYLALSADRAEAFGVFQEIRRNLQSLTA